MRGQHLGASIGRIDAQFKSKVGNLATRWSNTLLTETRAANDGD